MFSGPGGGGGDLNGMHPASDAVHSASRRTSAEAAASLLGTEQVPAVQPAFQGSPMAAASLGLGERSLMVLRSALVSLVNQPAPQPRVRVACHAAHAKLLWCMVCRWRIELLRNHAASPHDENMLASCVLNLA